MSTLEHAIPEHYFNDLTKCNPVGINAPVAGLPTCPQGVSAVKAIGLGAQAGQKIFTITAKVYQDNPSIVGVSLFAHSQSTKNRVQQALDAGYEVTIHEAPITQDGWTGAGYTIIDPNTGAGGYLIEGGANGGFFKFLGAVFLKPELLRTPCGESFLQDTIDRFFASNNMIPGMTLPVGATLLTAGVVAKAIGGYTFFQFAQLSLRNPQFLLGNTTVLGLSALANNLLMGLTFEIGMAIGSGVSAATCREE